MLLIDRIWKNFTAKLLDRLLELRGQLYRQELKLVLEVSIFLLNVISLSFADNSTLGPAWIIRDV